MKCIDERRGGTYLHNISMKEKFNVDNTHKNAANIYVYKYFKLNSTAIDVH